MLVAGASLSLLAPVASQASDVLNLEEMNSYTRSQVNSSIIDSKTFINEVSEDIANLKGRVDGLEAKQNVLEAGGFSDTTTMDGKAIFTIGAVEYDDDSGNSEAVQAYYSYTMNLNSSFTGDDNLYVRIKSGNGGDFTTSKDYGTYLSSAKGNSDVLKIDKIWYQFPLGESNTFWVGPKIENYYMHGTSPSIYKPVTKQFTLGGNGNAYGASTDTGFGWAYKADNGFALSSNIGTKSTTTNGITGLLTDESKTSWATQIGYTQPRYSVSAIANVKSNGWGDSYYKAGDINGDAEDGDEYTAIGLRGWWRPDTAGTATPSISVGYDTTDYDSSTADAWFVGLNWQDIFNADDKIGAAFGQPTSNEDSDVTPFAYELYYAFKPNDSITVTPAIFGGSDRNGVSGGDVFGTVLETTFKF
ncbi:putative porin precursor [Prochlorococcus marinus str. SB]|uniref:Putative porin n=2 Tax=Prochlorococcus marinus TaxID=1219 RepID=A0A0A2B911_PROMR|nr:putative porin precursor [Prochlorococcus marinus str. SB]